MLLFDWQKLVTTLEDLKDLIKPNNPGVKNFALAFVNEILHHRIPEYLLISLQNMKESGNLEHLPEDDMLCKLVHNSLDVYDLCIPRRDVDACFRDIISLCHVFISFFMGNFDEFAKGIDDNTNKIPVMSQSRHSAFDLKDLVSKCDSILNNSLENQLNSDSLKPSPSFAQLLIESKSLQELLLRILKYIRFLKQVTQLACPVYYLQVVALQIKSLSTQITGAPDCLKLVANMKVVLERLYIVSGRDSVLLHIMNGDVTDDSESLDMNDSEGKHDLVMYCLHFSILKIS